jgi:hypothetical protein
MNKDSNDPVARLLELHAADKLRSYIYNLSAVTHAAQNKWIPAEDSSGVSEFMANLQQHLVSIGQSENDSFLLRYCLTIPGSQRGIIPPLMVLQENRGGFSVRRQQEAVGQIERLREALTIGHFFFTGLSTHTEDAIHELVVECGRLPILNDDKSLAEFRQLTEVEAEHLAAEAIRCIDTLRKPLVEIGTDILLFLACFRDKGLSDATCEALLARKIFWPSSIYRSASELVANQLVDLISKATHTLALDHLILALAWTRSDTAIQAFQTWSHQRPTWAASLYVPPEEYLPSAGWCLDQKGNRRELISSSCHRLVINETPDTANIICRKSLSEKCPSCGGRLSFLFDFRAANEQFLAAEMPDAPRNILCCLHCSCYGITFSRYNPDGSAEWLSPLEPTKFANNDTCWEPSFRSIEASSSPQYANAEPFTFHDASTLGGIPSWLQSAEFPRCLDCGQFMNFLAQHDNGPLSEEGIFYAFFCPECRVAAVNYQQT